MMKSITVRTLSRTNRGLFVLGDSKVAHFDMGDIVTLKIRAVRTTFDLDMVVAHDVVNVERGPEPIAYEVATEEFTLDDIARVKRVTGVVQTEPDTFGSFSIMDEDGNVFGISLDVEPLAAGLPTRSEAPFKPLVQ